MIICFGIQFPQKLAALSYIVGGLLSPAPLQALNGAAGNKNCVNQTVYALIAPTCMIIPEQLDLI
jgi:hypothetical protein